jgi:hypothetical protein
MENATRNVTLVVERDLLLAARKVALTGPGEPERKSIPLRKFGKADALQELVTCEEKCARGRKVPGLLIRLANRRGRGYKGMNEHRRWTFSYEGRI